MVKDPPLPFKVGELVETKSFLPGYRGAWFHCKITKTSWRRDRVGHVLHYIDFPDEEEEWMESYQVPPTGRNKRKEPLSGGKRGMERERHLMLRPSYPRIYRNDQIPSTSAPAEVIVITESSWHVGDLVDWLKDGCYWSGKVTQILGNEEAMVELMPPPMGEGQSYKASFSELRPSLDWSPKNGWTVPTLEDVANFHQCIQIVYPVTQTVGGSQLPSEVPAKCEEKIDHPVAVGLPCALASDSHVQVRSAGDDEMPIEPQSLVKEVISTTGTSVKRLEDNCSDSSKRFKACVDVPLISTKVDTLEAAIMDLEELANKLTWLKEILKFGMPLSNAATPSWKFVEHHGPSMPK